MADTLRYKKIKDVLTDREKTIKNSSQVLLAKINPKIAEVFVAGVLAHAYSPTLLTNDPIEAREIEAVKVAEKKLDEIKKNASTEAWIDSVLGRLANANASGESETNVSVSKDKSNTQKQEDNYAKHRSVLNVDKNATPEDIRKAYREEIVKYHPDSPSLQNATDEEKAAAYEKTLALNEAFAVLYLAERKNMAVQGETQPTQQQPQQQGAGFSLPSTVTDKATGFVKGKIQQFVPESFKNFGTGIAKRLGKEAATKAGTQIAAKAGVTVSAQLAGASVPIIGNVIAFIATEVLPRIKKTLSRVFNAVLGFVGQITGERDKRKQAAYLILASGGALLLGGYTLAGAGLMAFGFAAGVAPGFLASALGAAMFIPNLVVGVLIQAAIMLFATVFQATIIILLGTVLIYTVIQIGAYTVPQGGFGTETEMGVRGQFIPSQIDPGFLPDPDFPRRGTLPHRTQYINIDKSASTTNMRNDSGTQTVTYSVTIQAPRSDISLREMVCTNTLYGTGTAPAGSEPNVRGIHINADGSYTITYTSNIDTNSINDAVITDRCCVTATVEDTNRGACSSASIVIGTPPLNCANPNEDSFNGYGTELSNLTAAIASIAATSPGFASALCGCGDDLPICWDPGHSQVDSNAYGWHAGRRNCDIYLADGLDNVDQATWIVAHELTHHLQSCRPDISRCFANNPNLQNDRGPVCSYVYSRILLGLSEDMAESIGRYFSGYTGDRGSCFGGTFESAYPGHVAAINACIP